MNLIKLAQSYDPGRYTPRQVTQEEMELFVAFLEETVTPKQCKLALGRSDSYFYNWVRRCVVSLYEANNLTIKTQSRPNFVWKAKSYEDYKLIRQKA